VDRASKRYRCATVLRAASEIVLTIPRVGFFTTPAFFAGSGTVIASALA
jgi:hypothetical protein